MGNEEIKINGKYPENTDSPGMKVSARLEHIRGTDISKSH